MTRTELVTLAAKAEGIVLGFLLLTLVVHGAWLRARRRALSEPLEDARRALVKGDESAAAVARCRSALDRLPTEHQLRLLAELMPSIAGGRRLHLTELARGTGLVAKAQSLCASRSWKRRLRGVRMLSLLDAGGPEVIRLLDDPRAEVRAQAAEWSSQHPSEPVITRLIEMLEDPETLCRFTVRDSLARMGRAAIGPLATHLEAAEGARAQEPLRVASTLPDASMLAPALRLGSDRLALTRARAATLLGAIGGASAATRLTELLADESAQVRAQAARALGNLNHWPAVASLVRCLGDPVWEVRREAGLSLRRTGSPGEVLLRRARRSHDPHAADMAKLMLDLPRGLFS